MKSKGRGTFYLRSLLLVIACCAAAMGVARSIYSWHPYQFYSVLAPASSSLIASLSGAWLGGIFKVRLRRGTALLVLSSTIVATILVFFASYRCSESVLFDDDDWPRSWPFPDEALAFLNDWFDRRYPAQGDSLKLHGEFPKVRLVLDLVISVLSGVSGFVCRIILRPKV